MTVVLIAAALCAATLPGADAYVAARNAEAQGHYAEAVKHYADCAGHDDVLRSYALVREARCQALAGNEEDAVAQLEVVAGDPYAGSAQRLAGVELAACYARANRNGDAAVVMRRALDLPIRPRFLRACELTLADYLVASEDGEAEGYALYARLMSEARTRSDRIEAAQRLAKSSDVQHKLDAADALLFSGEDREAKRVLLSAAPALLLQGDAYRAQSYFLQGRLQLGAKDGSGRILLRDVAEKYPDSPWAADALLYLGRSLYGDGHHEDGESAFDRLAKKYPGTDETARGLWWLGQRKLSDGEPKDAAKVFLRLAEVCPEHKLADDAAVTAGNVLRDEKKTKDAIEAYQSLAKRDPYGPMTAEALFECGRLYESDGKTDDATTSYAQAARLVGQFCAHRAVERLEELGKVSARDLKATGAHSFIRPVPLGDLPNADYPESVQSAPWFKRLFFFAGRGYEEAEWEGVNLIPTMVNGPDPGVYYRALADAGLCALAAEIANVTGWGLRDDAPTLERLRVFYPRAYWGDVQRMARETGLDPYLILAVGRQESIFQSRVVSPAGATGVMQLMPGTADWLARIEPAVNGDHVGDLTDPANSLRLGAYYLIRMVERNDANLVYALASYNAGPGNVSKWKRQIPTSDMEAFLESIPFAETRGFVKKVLGNYAAYHSIYPEPSRIASAR